MGGLLDFPLVDELKMKVLHMKVSISPKYVLVDSQHMVDKTVSQMLSPLTVTEMVSNRNKGQDIYMFYDAFQEDVKKVFPNELTASQLLCLMDCTQLPSSQLHFWHFHHLTE